MRFGETKLKTENSETRLKTAVFHIPELQLYQDDVLVTFLCSIFQNSKFDFLFGFTESRKSKN